MVPLTFRAVGRKNARVQVCLGTMIPEASSRYPYDRRDSEPYRTTTIVVSTLIGATLPELVRHLISVPLAKG